MSSLSEKDIQARTSAQSFAKGQGYYRSGYVSDVVRRGDVVTAVVEGSEYEPYQVQITLDETGVADANCTCPYDWGGDCKHIVAVLLTLVHQAEAVVEKPELETVLDGLTEAQLRRVLLNLVAGRPELMAALEREVEWLQKRPALAASAALSASVPEHLAATVDVTAVRREIGKDFRVTGYSDSRRYDYYDYYDEESSIDLEAILRPHLDKLETLLDDGQVEAAASLLTTIIDAYAEGLNELDEWVYDENDYLIEEMRDELAEWLAEVLLSLELSPEEREEWRAQIESWEGDLGEMELAVTAVSQGWEYPPLTAVLQGQITDKGAWEGEAPAYADQLARARLRILERQERFQEYLYLAEAEGEHYLYVTMLARLGQIPKALAEARQLLTGPNEFFGLAQVLAGQGQMAAALEIGEFGLGVTEPGHTAVTIDQSGLQVASGGSKRELAIWLRDQAEQAGRPSLALEAAKVAFHHGGTLANYQAVERLAGNDWSLIKLELLPTLVKGGFAVEAIDIYLYEGMLAEAMKKIDAGGYFYYGHDLAKVIAATREKYPDWGIHKYRQLAERIMDGGKAKDYDTAVSYLRQARDIYAQHNRLEEWRAYLGGLLTTHQRKYKLVPMLREIR